MSAPLTPALAGFDEPIEMLRACHERIEQQCGTLERLVPHLDANGCDDGRARGGGGGAALLQPGRTCIITRTRSRISFHVCSHAANRRGRASARALLVASLLADHREMETLWAGLRRALEPLATGEASPPRWRSGRGSSARCTGRHIATEEGEALALAARLLASRQRYVRDRGVDGDAAWRQRIGDRFTRERGSRSR